MAYDFKAVEEEVLAFWERSDAFRKLQKKNKGHARFSFIDGPITANNPMGVHHAWGRTYKDLFQRFKALQGFDQRWQNGFDCQGLWVEVEVEKELGLRSKREIEEYGIEAETRDEIALSSALFTLVPLLLLLPLIAWLIVRIVRQELAPIRRLAAQQRRE